jgi:hypothetical protein
LAQKRDHQQRTGISSAVSASPGRTPPPRPPRGWCSHPITHMGHSSLESAILSPESGYPRNRRGGSGGEGCWPLLIQVLSASNPALHAQGRSPGGPHVPGMKRTGHRWPRGDTEGEAVIRISPKKSADGALRMEYWNSGMMGGLRGPPPQYSIIPTFQYSNVDGFGP